MNSHATILNTVNSDTENKIAQGQHIHMYAHTTNMMRLKAVFLIR